jgi:tryptophanase
VYAYCSTRNIPVFIDATRSVENAFLIQEHDPRYKDTHVRDILREMMMPTATAARCRGRKDFLINIGGLLAFKDNLAWKTEAEELLRVLEGSITSGGLAAADLAAMARGVEEMLDDRYVKLARTPDCQARRRCSSTPACPSSCRPGTHAIFLDARASSPTSTRTSTLRSASPPRSTWRRASGRWSEATSPRAEIR